MSGEEALLDVEEAVLVEATSEKITKDQQGITDTVTQSIEVRWLEKQKKLSKKWDSVLVGARTPVSNPFDLLGVPNYGR